MTALVANSRTAYFFDHTYLRIRFSLECDTAFLAFLAPTASMTSGEALSSVAALSTVEAVSAVEVVSPVEVVSWVEAVAPVVELERPTWRHRSW